MSSPSGPHPTHRFASARLLAVGVLTVLASCAPSRRDETPSDDAEKMPITSSSQEAVRLYLEGRDLEETLRAAEARERYRAAAAADPSFALAHFGLAVTATTPQERHDALQRAAKTAEKASQAERWLIHGLQYGSNSNPQAQEEYYRELAAAYPGDERAQDALGNYFYDEQRYEEAIAQFEKAIAINPRYAPAYNNLGYAYKLLGRYDEAESTLRQYLELVPDEPNPHDSYGELLMKVGRFAESKASYELALSKDPDFTSAYEGIAWNQMLEGDGEAARATLAVLLAGAPGDAERRQALLWTAASHLLEGDSERAVAEMWKRVELAEAAGDPAAAAGDVQLVGEIRLAAGDAEDARTAFERASALMEEAAVSDYVKDAARRTVPFHQARTALVAGDAERAAELLEAYRGAVASRGIAAEMRRLAELEGRIAFAGGDDAMALARLAEADREDPRVLLVAAQAAARLGERERARELAHRAAHWNAISFDFALARRDALALLATL